MYVVNVEGAIHRGDEYLVCVRSEEEDHAPGSLGLVGGKAEIEEPTNDVLENTLRREVKEETGVKVEGLKYVESKMFVDDNGIPVVDIVFLCRHSEGKPEVKEPDEIASIEWMGPEEIAEDESTPPWTERSIRLAEEKRKEVENNRTE